MKKGRSTVFVLLCCTLIFLFECNWKFENIEARNVETSKSASDGSDLERKIFELRE